LNLYLIKYRCQTASQVSLFVGLRAVVIRRFSLNETPLGLFKCISDYLLYFEKKIYIFQYHSKQVWISLSGLIEIICLKGKCQARKVMPLYMIVIFDLRISTLVWYFFFSFYLRIDRNLFRIMKKHVLTFHMWVKSQPSHIKG
jgi:hypothetical protein